MDPARLDEVRQRYDDWWDDASDQPIFYLIFPEDEVDFSPVAREWMAPEITGRWTNWRQEMVFGQGVELTLRTGDRRYVEEAIDLLDFYADVTGHAGEGYSFLLPGLGPGCLAAFISGYSEFHGGTIWFGLDEPWDAGRVAAIDADTRSDYGELAFEAIGRLVERLQWKFVIAMPDLGLGLDTLSPIRGVQNLLTDTIDRPAELKDALARIEAVWRKTHADLSAIIDPGNHGCYAEMMRYLSGRPTHISYCDFSAMISPAMFAEFVLPMVEREAERFGGRLAFHLDGPGQLPHVEQLCGVEGLRAIQWVSGAGNPGGLDECWYDLYRRIIDSGRKICLTGAPGPEPLRKLFQTFPKRAFLVPMVLKGRAEAEEVLRLRE